MSDINMLSEMERYTKADVQRVLEQNTKDLKEHIHKLNEENKNRRLSENELKDLLSNAIGLDNEAEFNLDTAKEKLLEVKENFLSLQNELETEREAKKQLDNNKKIKTLAEESGLEADLVVKLVDPNSDIASQIDVLKENYPQLKKRPNTIGTPSNPTAANKPKTIDTRIDEASKKGDIKTSIALKLIKHGLA